MNRINFVFLMLCVLVPWEAISAMNFSHLERLGGPSARASSTDPNLEGNGDCRPIAAGQTLELANLSGPGRITHLWFTVSAPDVPFYPRQLTLRIYWDNRTEPAVEAPLGDFFAVGHGEHRMVDSAMVATSGAEEGNAYNCYWPMPFATSARVAVTNDSDQDVFCFFWYVDWEQVASIPEDTPYFHAQYRQEFPAGSGDYLVLDTGPTGAGHYVGTVLTVRTRHAGWFGEGDDKFYLDGDSEPTIHGTGCEDYFSDAWGFRELNRAYYGITKFDGFIWNGLIGAYRWHIPDPIRFTSSLKFTLEHKGTFFDEQGNMVGQYMERDDDYASVAFWYQTGVPQRFADPYPVPGSARLAPSLLADATYLEFENLLNPLPMGAIVQPGEMWHNNQQVLFLRQDCSTDLITVPFSVSESGTYFLSLLATFASDFGQYDILLDGETVVSGYDFYRAHLVVREVPLDEHVLSAGDHTISYRCSGKNPASSNYLLGMDALMLQTRIQNVSQISIH